MTTWASSVVLACVLFCATGARAAGGEIVVSSGVPPSDAVLFVLGADGLRDIDFHPVQTAAQWQAMHAHAGQIAGVDLQAWASAAQLATLLRDLHDRGGFARVVLREERAPAPNELVHDKARVDQPSRVPELARGMVTGHGVVVLVNGMYWRDISRYAIDLDGKKLFYDAYAHGQPRSGSVSLDAAKLAHARAAWEAAWRSPHDNAARPGDPVLHGILAMPMVVLVDGAEQRVIDFSPTPLASVQELIAMALAAAR